MPINTVSPTENRLRLIGIKTIYGDSDPTTSIGSDMGIPTLYINNSSKDAFLLTSTDPVTWVDVGAISFGKNVLSILDASDAPPGAPGTGDAYLLDSTTTINAGWVTAGATYDDRVEWTGSSWLVQSPSQGDITYVNDVTTFYIYDGSDWILLSGSIVAVTYVSSAVMPKTTDNSYTVPTVWTDTTAKESYILSDVTGSVATWLKLGGNTLGDAQDSVLSIANSTNAPPTEVTGDRYILSSDGAPHADWDGAAQADIVEFDGGVWVARTPTEGTFCEVEDVDTVYIFITAWEKLFQATGATFTTDSGNAVPSATGVLTIAGTSAQGLTTSGASNTVTLTISDASVTQKGVSELATDAEVTAGSDSARTVVCSSLNQKLGAQTQYGIITGGGSTGNLEATAALTNGQIAVGSTGATPVAATPTGGSHLTYTGGAGTFDYDLSSNVDVTAIHGWNGAILENPAITVTSDGATITISLEKTGGGDLTLVFSDEFATLDCTPALTATLTAGTDTVPVLNYIYILQSAKTIMTVSTVSFPSAEHISIATVLCQSAASLQTDQAYKVHQWSDHLIDSNDQGHISHLNAWIRDQHATWKSGVAQTFTITPNGGAADNVIITTASGVVLQLHTHAFPAFSGTPDLYTVNDSGTAYNKVTDMNALLTDSTGASMSAKYFSLVLWGVVSEATGDCKLMVNLPNGSYNTSSLLSLDSSKYADFSIPSAFKGTGFLIAQWNLRHQTAASGTWTSIDEIDLRGFFPNTTSGGTTAIPSEFIDNAFRILDNSDNTKEIAFEASGITTATTRTITMPDQNVDLTPTTGTFQGVDATLTALAAYNTNGLLTQTAADTFTGRTLTGTANQVNIANGDGVSGNPTFSLPQSIDTAATVQFAKLGLGTATVPHGGVGSSLLAIEGANASVVSGPHVQFTTASDDYPLFQILNYQHDDIELMFDSYFDGAANKSSDAGTNFRFRKHADSIKIDGDNGIAQGGTVTFANYFQVNADGAVIMPLQPCFQARPNGDKNDVTGDATNYTIVWDLEIFDQGGDFDGTSTFTAPVVAKYELETSVLMHDLTSSHTTSLGQIITSNRSQNYRWNPANSRGSDTFAGIQYGFITDMDAADTATVTMRVTGGTKVVDIGGSGGTDFSSFSGGIFA